METQFVQVTSTIDSEDTATLLVRKVVGARLAACGQVSGPVSSVYWWENSVQAEDEFLMVFKTTSLAASGLVEFLRRNHTYENPEIVVTPIIGGSEDYLEWISSETSR